jgi:hypothetical protein
MLYPNLTGMIFVSILLTKRRSPPKFILSFLSINHQIMWRSFLSSLSLLKKKVRRRRRRGVK